MMEESFNSVSVAQLNNAGASFLQEGQYENAIMLFRGAAEAVKVAVRSQNTNENFEYASSISNIMEANICLSKHRESLVLGCLYKITPAKDIKDHVTTERKNEPEKISLYNQEMNMKIYTQPMKLNPHNPSKDADDVKKYSSIIIYNLALTYHIRGTREVSKFYIDLALKLYKLSLRVAFNLQNTNLKDFGKRTTTKLLTFALLNNSAIIFFDEAMYHEAKFLLRILSNMMLKALPGELSAHEFEHFVMNVMLHPCSPNAPAA
mmetsp:Transcript_787/g.1055  ORF Transcript_787/g.1055 Transcript_787/m.1055 type:complete len:263 (-) Transcript_787:30-818(-)